MLRSWGNEGKGDRSVRGIVNGYNGCAGIASAFGVVNEFVVVEIQSLRNVCIGSIFVARRAGRLEAMSAMAMTSVAMRR